MASGSQQRTMSAEWPQVPDQEPLGAPPVRFPHSGGDFFTRPDGLGALYAVLAHASCASGAVN